MSINIGDEVFFARGDNILVGTVAKVLGAQLRVEFKDFVLLNENMVVPVPKEKPVILAQSGKEAPTTMVQKKKKK